MHVRSLTPEERFRKLENGVRYRCPETERNYKEGQDLNRILRDYEPNPGQKGVGVMFIVLTGLQQREIVVLPHACCPSSEHIRLRFKT